MQSLETKRGRHLQLTRLPGVGPRIAERLVAFFGSEEEALAAIEGGQADRVAEALGSYRKAVKLIRAYNAAVAGYDPEEFLATGEARDLYAEIIEIISALAYSRPARMRLETLTPVPAYALSRSLMGQCPRLRETLNSRVAAFLRKLERPPILSKRINADLIVVVDKASDIGKVEEKLRRAGIAASVVTVEEYISMTPPPPAVASSHDVAIESLDSVLGVLAAPLEPLLAPRTVLKAASAAAAAAKALLELSRSHPDTLAKAASRLGIGDQELATLLNAARSLVEAVEVYEARRLGEEYARLSAAVKRFDSVVTDVEVWANDEARRRLESREYRMTAADLLKMLSAMEEGRVPVPEEIIEIFEEVSLEASKKAAEFLNLQEDEAQHLTGLIKVKPFLPLEVDQEVAARARRILSLKLSIVELKALTRLALKAWPGLQAANTMFNILVEADVLNACQLLREQVGGGEARLLGEGYTGVSISEGKELKLLSSGSGVEPVSYVIGCTPEKPAGTNCERIIFLTGANSGGKSTLLRLMAETVMTAQAGLPVPAREAHIAPFDRVYYIPKPAGMLSAGALETVLRTLARAVEEARRRRVLLLIDEFEAVTEAHAATMILKTVVEELAETGSVSVIVSHMADEIVSRISGEARRNVRIDGIEAEGLDDNYNLIVRRTPRYGLLARSTPELVVKKLVHTTTNAREKRFYKRLLENLR